MRSAIYYDHSPLNIRIDLPYPLCFPDYLLLVLNFHCDWVADYCMVVWACVGQGRRSQL